LIVEATAPAGYMTGSVSHYLRELKNSGEISDFSIKPGLPGSEPSVHIVIEDTESPTLSDTRVREIGQTALNKLKLEKL
jgi:hypothetical protein